jgi:hypothetical protein
MDNTEQDTDDLTPTERIFIVAYALAKGEQLTTRQIAKMTGITWQGARQMMDKGSRVVPVYRDGRLWREVE